MQKSYAFEQIKIVLGLMTLLLMTACMPQGGFNGASLTATPSASNHDSSTGDGTDLVAPPPALGNDGPVVAPLWESKSAQGASWTAMSNAIVDQYGTALIPGSSDVANFCPNYQNLSRTQKINFWSYLVSAVVKYESDFSPTNRYIESTMGTDPITGQPVASEGLLQLSYQDVQAYSYCNEFNWSVDRHLALTDSRKTIFDPEKNLRCGIRILNHQVSRYGAIAFDHGNYWSTLMPNGHYSSYSKIKALTNSMSTCQLAAH